MLTFVDRTRDLGRREFLRIGSLGFGGMALSQLNAAAAAAPANVVSGKSVIFLFLHGGPSQTETFDPKMTAPVGIQSVTGEVATRLPGVTFGSTFQKLAALSDRISLVRSFVTGDGRHDIKPVVGTATRGANIGSIYSRVAGINNLVTSIPNNVALFPRSVDPNTQKANRNFGKIESTGNLSSSYAPFVPGAGGDLQQDMKLALPAARLEDRKRLLGELDRLKGRLAGGAGSDRFREQAFSTILGGVADSFDLAKEDPRTLARYDTAPLVKPENISRRWNNYNNYVDNAKSLGKLLLLARRLCEAGCGFVTVTTNFVWDMHADRNNAGVEEGMRYMGMPLDHAVSAFLEDVHSRGLSEQILLVVCGEMGRTPKVNKNGGRDHWGNLAPLLLTGGGLNMGQVIGQSSRDAGEPASDPIRIPNLISTIMHTLFDVGELRVQRGLPRDVVQIATEGDPIAGII